MTTFVRGRTVKTTEAVAVVDAGLAVGTHRFQLLVVSSSGRSSAPQVVDVVIARQVVVAPQPPVVRPPITPVVTPIVRPVVAPVVTPVVRPVRAPATAPKTQARKLARPAKPRSET